MARAYAVQDLQKRKYKIIPLTGEFADLLGEPERSGSWIVYGDSGHGKTTFMMQLCKELAKYFKVDYDTLEEGARKSMRDNLIANNMQSIKGGRFKILDKMPMDQLRKRLDNPRSAKVVVIDSIQYTFMTLREYKQLLINYPNHLFIWVSHVKGNKPEGRLAEKVLYDSDVKIHVQGFRAFSVSRANRNASQAHYTIWEEGAARFHDKI
jgi:hypothetical protein